MMLAHPQIHSVINFSEHTVQSLVIENPSFLRSFLQDLYDQMNGAEGVIVLLEQEKRLQIGSKVEIVDNFFCFPLNSKTLQNRIIAAMNQIAVSDGFYLKTAQILQQVEQYVGELAFSFDCDVVCEQCTVSALLKAVSVSVRDEYEDPLERLVDHMELVREFEQDKLFVLVNMRSFFNTEEVTAFLSTAKAHGFQILMLDSCAYDMAPAEKRLTIDKDLCEF